MLKLVRKFNVSIFYKIIKLLSKITLAPDFSMRYFYYVKLVNWNKKFELKTFGVKKQKYQ